MTVDTKYMSRCIQLALKGKGHTSPNPMVGAVIVCGDKIIGEGYHRQYGEAHAEVNAILSVKDKSLLKKSTLYVSLEPCSHYGKTPPCSQLIIDSQIPHVVIGCLDPFPEVSGRGLAMLNSAKIETEVGVLGDECALLNKEFNTAHQKNRPYIYLKWAQSKDGFLDKERTEQNTQPAFISNDFTKILVHKLRAEADAIMIATNTAIADNPSLTTRLWYGKNPVRIIIDKSLRIPISKNVFDGSVSTLIVTESENIPIKSKNIEYLFIPFDNNFLIHLFEALKVKGINSVMIEGGGKYLQAIIEANLWDEAFVEVGRSIFGAGTKAPIFCQKPEKEATYYQSRQLYFKNCQI